MNDATIPNGICARLVEDELVKEHLKSVIWFGSIRNKQDVHAKSDYDLQVILDRPTYDLTMQLNGILKDYPNVDLSIVYLNDVYDHNGKIIFQDGTKGLFFMYVLVGGEILYGRNMYAQAIGEFELADLKPSILFTIREYLSRLRVMAAQSPGDTFKFKKYSLKLFKDLLVYSGVVHFRDMPKIDNAEACKKIIFMHKFSTQSHEALTKITDYTHCYTSEEAAALLCEYERIVDGVCNGA